MRILIGHFDYALGRDPFQYNLLSVNEYESKQLVIVVLCCLIVIYHEKHGKEENIIVNIHS